MTTNPPSEISNVWNVEDERFLYVSPRDLKNPGGVLLSKDETHHALRVQRFRKGDRVRGIDGEGNEFIFLIGESQGHRVQLHIEGRRSSSREYPWDISLGMPLLHRPHRVDWMLEKATELGVKSIQPVVTHRTTVIPVKDRMSRRLERWERVIISAMKQSGRAWRPRLERPMELDEVLHSCGVRWVVWATPSGNPLPSGAELRHQGNDEFLILVGPEGGWEEEEEEKLRSVPGWAVSLGPHRLRSETAVVNLLSLLQDRLLSKKRGTDG